MSCLYYYKLISNYPCDTTKNCKLTINEIDSNFLSLKDDDIKSAEFVYDEGDVNNKSLILTRNNDEKLIVPLTDVTYNLDVDTICGEWKDWLHQ
jgi:predicted methyltransferase